LWPMCSDVRELHIASMTCGPPTPPASTLTVLFSGGLRGLFHNPVSRNFRLTSPFGFDKLKSPPPPPRHPPEVTPLQKPVPTPPRLITRMPRLPPRAPPLETSLARSHSRACVFIFAGALPILADSPSLLPLLPCSTGYGQVPLPPPPCWWCRWKGLGSYGFSVYPRFRFLSLMKCLFPS